jgi:Domain of unknown function (DUF4190)
VGRASHSSQVCTCERIARSCWALDRVPGWIGPPRNSWRVEHGRGIERDLTTGDVAVSDTSRGGWWLASDGKWYPPESHPAYSRPSTAQPWPPPSPAQTNGFATASFVLSLTLFVIGPILAIVFGARARRQIRRSGGLESGDGLALAGMIIGIVGLVLSVIVVCAFAGVIGTRSSRVQAQTTVQPQATAIAGAPGYWTTTGPVGLPFEEGRPWGTPCQPIVIDIYDTLPAPQVTLIEQAIQSARALGFDVTYAYPDNMWYPTNLYPPGQTNTSVQLVNIIPSEQWPSPVDDYGVNEHIQFGWDTRVSSNGMHEVLTDLTATLFLHAVAGDPQATKRAVRELIAFSLGVAGSSTTGSTIASGNAATRFSSSDINAMRRMSGCTLQPTTTSHPH